MQVVELGLSEPWKALTANWYYWSSVRGDNGRGAYHDIPDSRVPQSGSVVGMVGPWFPLEWPEPEITWHLSRPFFGRGYAREAARAVLAMTRVHLPAIAFISVIHPDNASSIKLAQALDATFERRIPFRGGEWELYQHQRPGSQGACPV